MRMEKETYISKHDIIEILKKDDFSDIVKQADYIRRENVGEEVHLRGICEFSNFCRKDCLYCGLRKSNKKIPRYRMSPEEILRTAVLIDKHGIKTIVLQSGEDIWFTKKILTKLIEDIKTHTDLAVTLSIGERSFDEYKVFKDAGADRYLLRFETSNENLFKKLHPDDDYHERLKCLQWFSDLGYQVGSGCMIGLPGQTIKDIADDILFIKKWNFHMVGAGPYISNDDTPLSGSKNGNFSIVQKFIALVRILCPKVLLPATTAMDILRSDAREIILQSGANVVMPNITPQKYKQNYRLYPDKPCIGEDPITCRYCMENRVKKIGRKIAQDHGHSLISIREK